VDAVRAHDLLLALRQVIGGVVRLDRLQDALGLVGTRRVRAVFRETDGMTGSRHRIGLNWVGMSVFGFPRTVNEKAARTVAGMVALTGVVALVTGSAWLLLPLAYGFWARVLTGPTLSPLAQLATRAVAPRLGAPKEVAGPPKRFAQAIGATITTAGAIAYLAGSTTIADVLLALVVVAATLESALAICVGCQIFAGLMRLGVIPEEVCVECANLNFR
jgi:hypothetical protein